MRSAVLSILGAAALLLTPAALEVRAQQPAGPSSPSHQASPAPAASLATTQSSVSTGIAEDELRRELVGKDLFLRGDYLDNTLAFDEHGALIGQSPRGSFTVCDIRINKVHLLKRKLELEGTRYGLHFLDALASEDPAMNVERINITPKKKAVHITIARERVVQPKKIKGRKKGASAAAAGAESGQSGAAGTEAATNPQAEELPGRKRAAMTQSQAHADQVLKTAIGNVFAQGLDERAMAAMPGYWKPYHQNAFGKAASWPDDPGVLRLSAVDQKARILAVSEPASNQFAQDHGVAGPAEYRVVVGADGKPREIAVERPIGLGLDENAVATIQRAVFAPAIKDGKTVPVVVDVTVEFRIYSKRTAAESGSAPRQAPEAPVLPGPYSVQH
ncbi:MAG: energy transducer TonB [Terracidiphilus sp.]